MAKHNNDVLAWILMRGLVERSIGHKLMFSYHECYGLLVMLLASVQYWSICGKIYRKQ